VAIVVGDLEPAGIAMHGDDDAGEDGLEEVLTVLRGLEMGMWCGAFNGPGVVTGEDAVGRQADAQDVVTSRGQSDDGLVAVKVEHTVVRPVDAGDGAKAGPLGAGRRRDEAGGEEHAARHRLHAMPV
jgi:hypothetical protein